MTPELADRLVDALDLGFPDVETVCIHLYGGEPLLNLPSIHAMVKRAIQKPKGRITFAITTNGTIFLPEVFELLEAGRFFVILSIDGPSPIHDECRRTHSNEPTHSKVIKFLNTLKKKTCCKVWGSVVVRSGWSLLDAEGYLNTLPIDAIKAQAIRTYEGSSFAMTTKERIDYMNHLSFLGRKVIKNLEQGNRHRDNRFSSHVFQLLSGTSRKRYCQAGILNFGITPNGTVLNCLLLEEKMNKIGHIYDDPATWRRAGAAWANSKINDVRCVNCSAMPLCGGGCPAIIPFCGDTECEFIRRNCEVAEEIFEHFRARPDFLLGLAGIF